MHYKEYLSESYCFQLKVSQPENSPSAGQQSEQRIQTMPL